MATEVTYTGDGTDVTFDITFPFLKSSDVKIQLDGTTKNTPADYSITGNVVTFVSAPTNGATVRLYRNTDKTIPQATFNAGSAIKAEELNNNVLQALYALQEIGTVTANDQGLGLTSGNKGDIQVVSATDWYIKTDAVESNMLNTNSVTSDAIATNSVTSDAIAANAVGTSELDSSINTTLNAVAGKAETGANLSTFTNDTAYITQAQVPTSFVTGMILMYTGTTAPTGWALCDGTNGTPNLRDRFIVGSGNLYSNGDTGGQADAIIPDHTHPTTFDGNKYFPGAGSTSIGYGGAGGYPADVFSMSNPSNGESVTNKNLPPYYALCFIVKL